MITSREKWRLRTAEISLSLWQCHLWGTRWEFQNCIFIIVGHKPGFWAKTCGRSCCFQKAEFTVVLRTQLGCDNTGTCDVHRKYVFRKIFSKIIILDLLLLSPSPSPLSPDSLSSHQGFFFNLPRHRMRICPLRLAECFSNQTKSFLALAIRETELLCF